MVTETIANLISEIYKPQIEAQINDGIRSLPCPYCKAKAFRNCIFIGIPWREGGTMETLHAARVKAFNELEFKELSGETRDHQE